MFLARIRIDCTDPTSAAGGCWSVARFLPRLVCAAALAALPSLAVAEISWHRDLAAARAASASSGKPVFALFVAKWDDKPGPEVFSNAEVEAVIAACFEPVRVDVDAQPDTVRAFDIQRVPSVAVLDAKGEAISRFDCPATPAEFVAASARAAQVAAAGDAPREEAQQATAVGFAPFRGGFEAESKVEDTSVADKVRQLSSFADSKSAPLRDPSRFPAIAAPSAYPTQHTPTAQPMAAPVTSPVPANATAPYGEPALARTPPPAAWPSQQPAASSYAQFQPAAPPAAAAPTIEPAPTNPNPWLAPGVATPGLPAADAEPEASATASDEGTSKKPESSGFMAAIQKPMSVFSKWTAKPVVAPPPKMPPALPQRPSALAASAGSIPPAAAARAPVADSHGSMPLGLEGYCPVTIAERSAWVEGRAQWGVRHRGRTYLFAGPEQQRAFMAEPDRYAPALSGDDPVLAFESGRSEAGRRTFGITYQSRMYLFASPETRAAFSADPNRYTTRVQIAEGLAPADAARRF